MNTKTIKTKAGTFYLKDNILYSFLEGAITLEKAIDHIDQIKKHVLHLDGCPFLTFNDLVGLKSITRDARTYLGNEETQKVVKKNALLITSILQKMMANLFITFSNPRYPVRLFTNREKAFEWLGEG